MKTIRRPHDVDIDRLAASLRTIADGIESQDIPVVEVSSGIDVEDDGDVTASISVAYLLTDDYEHSHEIQFGGDHV